MPCKQYFQQKVKNLLHILGRICWCELQWDAVNTMPCISGSIETLALEDVAQVTSTGWACNFHTTAIRITLRHTTHYPVDLGLVLHYHSCGLGQKLNDHCQWLNMLIMCRMDISQHTSKPMQKLNRKRKVQRNEKDSHARTVSLMAPGIPSKNAGHPQPESNFVVDL